MTRSSPNSTSTLTAAALPDIPARRLVFAVIYSFADISEVYADIPPLMNKAVHDRCQEDGVRIRVDKKDIKPESCGMEFEGDLDFRFDLTQQTLGAQFVAPARIPVAVKLIKQYVGDTLALLQERGLLPPQNAEAVSLDIQHKFSLANPHRKNRHITNEKLIRGIGDGQGIFASLVPAVDDLGRVDVKFSCLAKKGHRLFIAVECPGNDDYSTVWPSYNCRTEEDVFPRGVQDLGKFVGTFIDEAYACFKNEYALFLERLLAGESIDLARKPD